MQRVDGSSILPESTILKYMQTLNRSQITNNGWHVKSITDILSLLSSNKRGLNNDDVNRRLQKYGENKLPESKTDNLFILLLRQFQSPLIYILLAASAVIFFIGEIVDSFIILALLFFNAIVGAFQEGKAQNTILALKKFTETKATVLRDGKEFIIPDLEVVPGDIVILQGGEKVPADARIFVSNGLKVDEAAMTGESEPVNKIIEASSMSDAPIAEQKNMVFKGTYILSGNGKAVIVATGVKTVIGKIAKQISTINTEIPLKANIRYLSRLIIIAVVGICTALFAFGLISGKPLTEMFVTVVSLAVAIIPEGLPIVVTLILATGVWRMSKRNALIKKLQAVETLGQVRIIAVDKTGTITKNELVIKKVYVNGKLFNVGGVGYEPKGDVFFNETIVNPLNQPELILAGKIATYCSDARVKFVEENNQWQIAGDPTEAAMLVFAQKLGVNKDKIEHLSPITAQIPFDYKLKYHAVAHGKSKKTLTMVGAPEVILKLSERIWHNGKNNALSKKEKNELETIFVNMSREGLRVVAFAETENVPNVLNPDTIAGLTFVGFFAIKDALRAEVAIAIQQATLAGIKVIMITGDHKITAAAIAREAGIYQTGDVILTGSEIDAMSDKVLSAHLSNVTVFARVNPEHKLKIIKAYKARGEIIAMTGDGVNDALSLVAADLGVAMGKIGTEVAKEAADIILLDDNFKSIISAVEEGRSIYKTIKKVILYLFSTNLGEVLAITGALLLGYPLPILAAQIIWLNFITDGFLDVALAMGPKDKKLLHDKFERPKKYLIDKLMAQRMFLMALTMAIGTLLLFKNHIGEDMTKAWTISLTIMAAFQWFNAWNCHSEDKSIFQLNPFSNKFLIGATIIVVSFQLFAVYNPLMQKILHTTALEIFDWFIIILIAASILVTEEIRKFFYRRRIVKKIPVLTENKLKKIVQFS